MDPSRPDPLFQFYLESLEQQANQAPSPSARQPAHQQQQQQQASYSAPSATQQAFLEHQRLASGGGFQSQQSSDDFPNNLAGNDRAASLQQLQQLASLRDETEGPYQQQSLQNYLPGGASTTAPSGLSAVYPNQNPSMFGNTRSIDSSFLSIANQEALLQHLLGQQQREIGESASLQHLPLVEQVRQQYLLESGRRLQDHQQELQQQQLLQQITSQRQLGQERERDQTLQQHLQLLSQLYPSTAIPQPQAAHAPAPLNSPSFEPFSQNRFIPATPTEQSIPAFLPSLPTTSLPPSLGGFDVAARSGKRPREQRVFPLTRSLDKIYLTSYQICVRQQLELFSSDTRDCLANQQGRRKRVKMGQIGIRCKHCAHLPLQDRGRASCYYPHKLIGVYQAAQNIATTHLADSCSCIPAGVREELHKLHQRKETADGGKAYWSDACIQMGLVDDEEIGIMYGPDAEG